MFSRIVDIISCNFNELSIRNLGFDHSLSMRHFIKKSQWSSSKKSTKNSTRDSKTRKDFQNAIRIVFMVVHNFHTIVKLLDLGIYYML